MAEKPVINIFWFRRDLRLHDNAGLYHALKGDGPVLCLFIFDREILDKLEDKNDARVTFIHQTIEDLDRQLKKHNSALLVRYGMPNHIWDELLKEYRIGTVYTNHDYEPYARQRDGAIADKLKHHHISLKTYKDQVIFEKNEVVKDDGQPYTVYTPYMRKWYQKLEPFCLKPYPTEKYFKNFYRHKGFDIPSLQSMGFEKNNRKFPGKTMMIS